MWKPLTVLVALWGTSWSYPEMVGSPATPMEMISSHGYHPEEHTVISDGYHLTMHRIHHGKEDSCINEYAKLPHCKKPVVFLQHGIMGSSADFLIAGPTRGLAYILADAGFDVWMGNARGNSYSRCHDNMTPNNRNFWQFSWHELGAKDLPKMIDFVLQKTGERKLHYIGHSQGTTTFLVMTSTHPEYNDKIKCAHLMAPVAFMKNVRNPLMQALNDATSDMTSTDRTMGTGEFVPNADLIHRVGNTVCQNHQSHQVPENVCRNPYYQLTGFDNERLGRDLVTKIVQRNPTGVSVRQLMHYIQEMRNERFCQYDYGSDTENTKMYGSTTPPSYNLENVRVPIHMYYGKDDWLVPVEDVNTLKNKLRTVKTDKLVTHENWKHSDFLWANDVKEVIYNAVIAKLRERVEDSRSTSQENSSEEGRP